MKSNKNEQNIWLLIFFGLMAAISIFNMLTTPLLDNDDQATEGTVATTPLNRHYLEKITINTKYNDGASCEFFVDPVTDIVYMVFDSYDMGGITTMLHPNTGKPMLLKEFYQLYAEYIPTEPPTSETEAAIP